MESSFLEHLLSTENQSQYLATFPMFKFYRLYEDRSSLSDEEHQSQSFVHNDEKSGFHVLNPFFISVLRDHSVWFAPSTQFNDPWDAGGAVSILRTSPAIEEPILKLLFGEEEYAKVSLLGVGDPNSPGKGGTVSFSKTSLTKVILGCKVPPALWTAAENILDDFGYTHTELVRAEFDYRTQSLKFLRKIREQQSQAESESNGDR